MVVRSLFFNNIYTGIVDILVRIKNKCDANSYWETYNNVNCKWNYIFFFMLPQKCNSLREYDNTEMKIIEYYSPFECYRPPKTIN